MEQRGRHEGGDIQAYQIGFGQLKFMDSDAQVAQNCQTPYPKHPHGCPEWGKNWCCTPYAPPIAETKASLETYPYLWLVVATINLDTSRVPWYKRWRDRQTYTHVTQSLNQVLDYLRATHPDWIVFSCSHCELCQEKGLGACPCPNRPCRFPDAARTSPEAAGVDIFATLRQIGVKLDQSPTKEAKRVALIASDERIAIQSLMAEYETFLQNKGKFEGGI